MTKSKRICLVSPGHVSANPRLVKEADALSEAGYEVHVVAGRYFPVLDANDQAILTNAKWICHRVDYASGLKAMADKATRRILRGPAAALTRNSLLRAGAAHHAAVPRLAQAARRAQADLIIGHCLAGLAAAAVAADDSRSKLAFDAEDFHSGESALAIDDPVERKLIEQIESTCLPRCTYVTASSPAIARAYATQYGIGEPTTILNVFPLSEAPAAPSAPRSGNVRKLYWFSQTIGPGRGLEAIVPVLAAMQTPCELHLRGIEASGFRQALQEIARRAGFRGNIHFQELAPAREMVRLASEYDLGLSLELVSPRNRDLCLTNKIFTYLLAGLPVAMSRTQAQDELLPALGDAAIALDLTKADAAARSMDAFFADESRYARARDNRMGSGADSIQLGSRAGETPGPGDEIPARRSVSRTAPASPFRSTESEFPCASC